MKIGRKMNRDLLDLKSNLNLIFRFDKCFKNFFVSRTQKAVSVCQLKRILNIFTVMSKANLLVTCRKLISSLI